MPKITSIQIRKTIFEKLKKAHAKHIGKEEKVIPFVDFSEKVIEAGLSKFQ